MKKNQTIISRIILATACVFSLSGCGESDNISKVVFDENYQEVWKVGEIDFSKLFFIVTHENGVIENVPVDISMINEKDIYKFYEVGDWKVKINYSANSYAIVDFTIVENEFSEDLKLKSEVITYDGQSHGLRLEGPMPEGTNVYFPYGNSFTQYSQNPYQVKCIVSKEGYKTKELYGDLTITQAEYEKEILDKIVFEDAEFTYDGTEKKIEASNIPSDCSIEYFIDETQGNSRINVGAYEITGVIKCSNLNYKPISNIHAKLTINKATYDMSNVKYQDKVVMYQKGIQQTLFIDPSIELPSGVSVRYENNIHEDVGVYECTAYFDVDSNHNEIEPLTATLTVTKKIIDLGNLVIQKSQRTRFDGTEKEFEIDVPENIVVKRHYFSKNGSELSKAPIEVGTYTVRADFDLEEGFKASNYELLNVPKFEGILTIEKKKIDLKTLNFVSQKYTYDGKQHDFDVETTIEVDGKEVVNKVPEELEIVKTYTLNGEKVEGAPIEVGTYSVDFDVRLKNGLVANNYDIENIPTASGRLTIAKKVIDLSNVIFSDQAVMYDAENKKPQAYVLEGVPEDSVITEIVYSTSQGVRVEPENLIDAGRYVVQISFKLNEEKGYDPEHYQLLNGKSQRVNFEIKQYVIDFVDILVTDVEVDLVETGTFYPYTGIVNFAKISSYVVPVYTYYDENFKPLVGGRPPTTKGLYFVDVDFALRNDLDAKNFYFNEKTLSRVSMLVK